MTPTVIVCTSILMLSMWTMYYSHLMNRFPSERTSVRESNSSEEDTCSSEGELTLHHIVRVSFPPHWTPRQKSMTTTSTVIFQKMSGMATWMLSLCWASTYHKVVLPQITEMPREFQPKSVKIWLLVTLTTFAEERLYDKWSLDTSPSRTHYLRNGHLSKLDIS